MSKSKKLRISGATRAHILSQGQLVTTKRFGFYRWYLNIIHTDPAADW
jgi:hypothetical protein